MALHTSSQMQWAITGVEYFIYYLTSWGVEPVVTQQTSWLTAQMYVACNKTKLVGKMP